MVFTLPTTVDTIDSSNSIITAEVLNTFLPSYLNLTTLYLDNCPKLDLNQLASNPKTLEIFGNLSTLKLSFRTSNLEGLTKLIVASNKLRKLYVNKISDIDEKTNLQELVSWLDDSQGKELNNRLANLNELTFADFFIEDIADLTRFLDAIDKLKSTTGTRPLSWVQGSFYLATNVPENELRKLIKNKWGTSINIAKPTEQEYLRRCNIQIDMTMRPGRQSLEDTLDPFPVNTQRQRRTLPQLMQNSWNYTLSCIVGYQRLLNPYGRIFLNSLWGLRYMGFNLSATRRFVETFFARPPSLPPAQNA